MSLTTKCIAF